MKSYLPLKQQLTLSLKKIMPILLGVITIAFVNIEKKPHAPNEKVERKSLSK